MSGVIFIGLVKVYSSDVQYRHKLCEVIFFLCASIHANLIFAWHGEPGDEVNAWLPNLYLSLTYLHLT